MNTIIEVDEQFATKLTLHRTPQITSTFVEYRYSKQISITVVKNSYALKVTNWSNYNDYNSVNQSVVSSLVNIDTNHNLSVLVPVVDFRWHKNSKNLMKT